MAEPAPKPLSKLAGYSICAAIIATGALVYWLALPANRTDAPRATPSPLAEQKPKPVGTPPPETKKATLAPPQPGEEDEPVKSALARLQEGLEPAEAKKLLAELRAYLLSLPPEVGLRLTREFLASAADAKTKLAFKIANDGSLEEAPTLRTWMLDTLSKIDPQAAADLAREILSDRGPNSSADEWALGLRDFAKVRTAPQDKGFLQEKMRELLANTQWRQDPSSGYLEAFDTIVYLGSPDFTPDLTRMITDTKNQAVGHAAYLTLDRLVIQNPAVTLQQLQQDPPLMAGREQTRANYFARADVRDPQQRTVLESYLLDATRSPQELDTFAGLYPSGNFMISHNLLTQTETPPQPQIAAHDRQALATVNEWLADPRFGKIQPQLQKMKQRLETFVKQAATP